MNGVFTPDFAIFIVMKCSNSGNEDSAYFILPGGCYLPCVVIDSFDEAMSRMEMADGYYICGKFERRITKIRTIRVGDYYFAFLFDTETGMP